MFKTDRILLRGYQPSDQGFFLDLLNTYEVLVGLTSAFTTPGHDARLEMLNTMSKYAFFVVVCDKESLEMMGFALVNIATPRNLDGEIAMALHKSHWSKGYATEILNWLMGYSFKVLGLRRLSISVYSSNTRAISVYEKIGFKHEGRRREVLWKEGAWVDLVWMGLLSTEYHAARQVLVSSEP